MSKVWKYHPEECEWCGGSAEIYTDKDFGEGWGYDGDDLRCTSCGARGVWVVVEKDEAYGNWDLPQAWTPLEVYLHAGRVYSLHVLDVVFRGEMVGFVGWDGFEVKLPTKDIEKVVEVRL